MKKSKNTVLLFLFLAIAFGGISQPANNTSVAIGVAANGSLVQLGPDIRVYIPLSKRFIFVPEYYHYGLGATRNESRNYLVNEFYVNMNLRADVYSGKRIRIYLVGGYVFTRWINEDSVALGKNNYHGIDGGIGIEYHFRSFSIFSEHRINSVWGEYNTFLGIRGRLSFRKMYRKIAKKRYDLDDYYQSLPGL